MAEGNDTTNTKRTTVEERNAYYRDKWKRQRAQNPEKYKASLRARSKRYYAKQREQMSDEELEVRREAARERNRKYRENRSDAPEYKARNAANARKYYAANPQKFLDVVHRRRSKLEEGSVTAEEWNAILARYGHRCAYCRRGDVKLGQDHVQALTKGGAHVPGNVVPCCRSCNTRKGNRPCPFPEPTGGG